MQRRDYVQQLSSMNTDLFLGGSSLNENYQNISGWEEVCSELKPIIIRSRKSMEVIFYIGKSVFFTLSKDYRTLTI